MKKKKETFADYIGQFQYHFDRRPVFDDFLTMALTLMCPNPLTGLSHDEELYMETIKKYATHELRHQFPKMLAALIEEMEERSGSSGGNDVLGEFYEHEISKGKMGQFFTPWHVCELMAQLSYENKTEPEKRLRVLDPTCGSGRILLAWNRVMGRLHDYYGIDLDHTCVKMAAVNLFLNGVFHGEVMCADAVRPDHFISSYKLSMFPFGVFRISNKENSPLWHLHRDAFIKGEPVVSKMGNNTGGNHTGSQLSFF